MQKWQLTLSFFKLAENWAVRRAVQQRMLEQAEDRHKRATDDKQRRIEQRNQVVQMHRARQQGKVLFKLNCLTRSLL